MATQNIILNSSNIVAGSKNRQLVYKFPNPQQFNNSQIALGSLQMYYSWYNINSTLYNNNRFQYKWFNSVGALTTIVDVIIPDGYYTVDALNIFLTNEMTKNGHYTQKSGKKSYYIEFVTNPNYYSVQLNITPMPTALPSGTTIPTTSWNLPATQMTPQITILGIGNFDKVIGFNAGTYPVTTRSTLFQKVSDFAPQLTPVSSLVVRCNIARNTYSVPNDVIYSFSSGSTFFGEIIDKEPTTLLYSPVINGSFDNITISFTDQQFNPVHIIDPSMLITLVIKTS